MKKTVAATLFVGLLAQPLVAAAPPYTSEAPIAYLKDLSSGAVLYDKGGETRMPPASMAKMMTVHVVFDMIKRGEVKRMVVVPKLNGNRPTLASSGGKSGGKTLLGMFSRGSDS